MVLSKRILRNFRNNLLKYIAIIAVIILSMAVVTGYGNTSFSVEKTMDDYWERTNVEDGEFSVYRELNSGEENHIKDRGVSLQKTFYYDSDEKNDVTLRAFRVRKDIDKLNVQAGSLSNMKDDEVALEQLFMEDNGYEVGDRINFDGHRYKIAACVNVPDYCHRVAEITDVGTDEGFGLIFMTDSEFSDVISGHPGDVVYNYTYTVDKGSVKDKSSDMFEYLDGDTDAGVFAFNRADRNSRITDFVDYHKMFFSTAIAAGILLALLLAYILSVFAVNNVEDDHVVIATLYAMGYRKKEILSHYMKLPVLAAAIGAVVGTFAGFGMTKYCITANYSHPDLIITHPVSLIIYGIVVPVAAAAIINYLVLNRKLSRKVLDIMSNKGGVRKHGRFDYRINAARSKFVKSFSINRLVKNLRSSVILFFGVSLSMLILMLGVSLYGSIAHYADTIADDLPYDYMYTVTGPVQDKPADSDTAYSKQMSAYCSMAGRDMPVVIQGLDSSNDEFDFADRLTGDKNEVYVSDSAVVKFGWEKGDKISLTDTLHDRKYTFTVAGTVNYKNGIYVFMNRGAMTERFGEDRDYYNTLLSNEKLSLHPQEEVNLTTKSSVVDTAHTWVSDTLGTIILFIVMSVMIFIIVAYLLMKNLIDRSSYSISLLKVLGFRSGELNRMYLRSSLYVTVISMAVILPVGSVIMKYLIPVLNASMKSGMACYIYPAHYLFMIVLVLLSYGLTYLFLRRKVMRIPESEVLKDRE